GLDRRLLVGSLAVRKRRFEALEPFVPEVECHPGRLLALRIQREQLAGKLADAFARTRLQVVPRLAAELRQRRDRRVRADVARHLSDLLVRDVEPVVAAEREQEVVARDARDLLRLEAQKLADAVVLVDDVVARAEVGERLQRACTKATLPRRPPAEDLRV